jgi:hypothetical protein
MTVYCAVFPTKFEQVSFWGSVCAPRSVHIKGVRDPLAPVRRAAETTIQQLGPCQEFAVAINLEPNRLQEALLWNLLGGIMCDLAVHEPMSGP